MKAEILLIALAVWCAVLTVVVLACIRQIAVMDLRLDKTLFSGTEPVDDGLELGQPMPQRVAAQLAAQPTGGPSFVVLMSSTCMTCRDLAFELRDATFDVPVVALVAGRSELVDAIVEALPASVTVVRDPEATAAAQALAVKTTPFVFEFRRDVLVAKAALRGADHFKRFVDEARTVLDTELELAISREEGSEDVRVR
jgi:uncharacterized protein YgbK (DUF1537 family)